MKIASKLNLILTLALGTLLALPASASSVAKIASLDLVEKAELIFQGEVIHRDSWRANNGRVYTAVEFHVQEVIKGTNPGPGLRLRFSGGSIGGITLSTGVPIPQMGEQGIYFVRSLSKPGANPLVGWSQGHFTIDADNAVRAGNGAIVTDIRAARSGATVEISEGLARGFSAVNPSGAEIVPVRALSPEEFKYRIRELWQGGPVVREAAQASTAVPQTTAEPAKPAKDPTLWASETPAE